MSDNAIKKMGDAEPAHETKLQDRIRWKIELAMKKINIIKTKQ